MDKLLDWLLKQSLGNVGMPYSVMSSNSAPIKIISDIQHSIYGAVVPFYISFLASRGDFQFTVPADSGDWHDIPWKSLGACAPDTCDECQFQLALLRSTAWAVSNVTLMNTGLPKR